MKSPDDRHETKPCCNTPIKMGFYCIGQDEMKFVFSQIEKKPYQEKLKREKIDSEKEESLECISPL